MSGPADWSDRAQSNRPSDQVRAKVMYCKPLTTLSLDQWMLNHQGFILGPYRSPPTANRWLHCGGGSYLFAEVQSAYSTAPADRVMCVCVCVCVSAYRYVCEERWKNRIIQNLMNLLWILSNSFPYLLLYIYIYIYTHKHTYIIYMCVCVCVCVCCIAT